MIFFTSDNSQEREYTMIFKRGIGKYNNWVRLKTWTVQMLIAKEKNQTEMHQIMLWYYINVAMFSIT